MVFWIFSKYPLYLSLILLAQHCALKIPNPQQTYDLLCLWRLHRRMKRSFIFGLSSYISCQIPRCFANLLVVRFPQVFFPETSVRKDFAHEVYLFGKRLEMALFFPEFEFRTTCVRRFLWCVPPKRSISVAQLSAE